MSVVWRRRTLRLERERSAARAESLLLGALQTDILRIAGSDEPDEAIAHMLRAARGTLGFSRALYFSVDREHGIAARWQIDGAPHVRPCGLVLNERAERSLLSVLRGGSKNGFGTGLTGAPVDDARPPYVLCRLAERTTTFGILYVDGRAPNAPPLRPQSVHALALATSLSIAKSMRLARAQELASRDELTGLLNRRALYERLLLELEACRRRGTPLTYLMIDYDDLKRVNDTRGHHEGDVVLRRVGYTLARASRHDDIVGRYGGDEFVVVLPGVSGARAAELVERLLTELRAEGLSCSIGAALFPHDAADETALRLAADRALYASKAAGKNGFSLA